MANNLHEQPANFSSAFGDGGDEPSDDELANLEHEMEEDEIWDGDPDSIMDDIAAGDAKSKQKPKEEPEADDAMSYVDTDTSLYDIAEQEEEDIDWNGSLEFA